MDIKKIEIAANRELSFKTRFFIRLFSLPVIWLFWAPSLFVGVAMVFSSVPSVEAYKRGIVENDPREMLCFNASFTQCGKQVIDAMCTIASQYTGKNVCYVSKWGSVADCTRHEVKHICVGGKWPVPSEDIPPPIPEPVPIDCKKELCA